MDRYSASAEKRDTVACFFVRQDIGLGPKNVQYHVVDLREVGYEAQLASQWACKRKGESDDNNIPKLGAVLIY